MMPEVTPMGLEGRSSPREPHLERQRRRHGEADARAHLDDLLPAQPARPRDSHALRERLIQDILQQAFLAHHRAV